MEKGYKIPQDFLGAQLGPSKSSTLTHAAPSLLGVEFFPNEKDQNKGEA